MLNVEKDIYKFRSDEWKKREKVNINELWLQEEEGLRNERKWRIKSVEKERKSKKNNNNVKKPDRLTRRLERVRGRRERVIGEGDRRRKKERKEK